MSKNSHGADLYDISKKYGFSIDEIKDFSSNINPFGPSRLAMKTVAENPQKAAIYPDADYLDLRRAIAEYSGALQDNILLASGASGFIKALTAFFEPQRALIYAPTYSEYEKELSKVSDKIFYYDLVKEDQFMPDVDKLTALIKAQNISFVLICNPNNPTGSILTRVQTEKLLCLKNTIFVIDETYVEFSDIDTYSSAALTDRYENLFIIRSTSKFFAVPGIRLGYLITGNSEYKKAYLEKDMLIWDINIFAQIMGEVMFLDTAYQEKVHKFVKNQRKLIYARLSKLKNIKLYPSKSNFLLAEIVDGTHTAPELREYLLKKAMVIRDCSSFKNLNDKFFRLCILSEDDNQNLMRQIEAFFAKG